MKFKTTLISCFLLFTHCALAQFSNTKLFFCDLPINISEEALISTIKLDTTKFVIDYSKKPNDRFYTFDAEIEHYYNSLPKPSKNPLLYIYSLKVILDDTLKFRIPKIEVIYVYENYLARRKSKKAYELIQKKIKGDYKTVRTPTVQKHDYSPWSEKETNYYSVDDDKIGPTTFPICVVTLSTKENSRMWRVSIEFTIEPILGLPKQP